MMILVLLVIRDSNGIKEIRNSLEFSDVEDYVVIFLSILSYFLRIYLNKQFEDT